MGERTDDLASQNDDYGTSAFDQSQDIAEQNQELMRENLSSTGAASEGVPVVVTSSTTDYVVEGTPRQYSQDQGLNTGDEDTSDESASEIRDDIEDTRARMGSTIDAIQEKLSPQNLIQQAKDTARDATIGKAQEMASNVADSARETGSSIMDTIRQNPVPVALTAVGLGWLFISARREASNRRDRDYWYGRYGRYDDRSRGGYPGYYGQQYQQPQQSQQQNGGGMSQMADKVQDTAGRVGGQVQQAASNVGDRMQDAANTVADKAGDMADYAQYQAQRTQGWLQQTWDDNPLLVTAGALALGTIVGLAIPETQMENQLMGDARDNLVQKAQDAAQDTVQKAQSAATNVTNQVQQQAQQQQQQAKSGKGTGTSH